MQEQTSTIKQLEEQLSTFPEKVSKLEEEVSELREENSGLRKRLIDRLNEKHERLPKRDRNCQKQKELLQSIQTILAISTQQTKLFREVIPDRDSRKEL